MSHGTSTLPEAIDKLAASTPDRLWVQFVASTEALTKKAPLVDISLGTLANAINRLAWHLKQYIPQSGNLDTTICYLAPNDIRYFIVACAATKARVKLLLSSPRNNLEAHQALFEQTGCRTLMGPVESCQSLRDTCGMEHVGMLTMDQVLDAEKVEPYPWDRSLADVAHEPFVILHTSGSTGEPKPVEVNHALVATIDAQQDLPDIDGRCITSSLWRNRRIYAGLPLFHSAGFNILSFSIFQGTQVVFGPSDGPPSVSTVDSILDMDVVSAGIMAPSLLAEIANEPTTLRKLARWDSVGFGGGPLPEAAGQAIFQHTKVLPLLGSTETFNLPELLPQAEDELVYHYYHPSLGMKFEPVSEGLCELVFTRDSKNERHQGAFCTFPDLQEYRMKDLYEEHPTKPGLWKYQGRMDDVVVLSNGEKVNPRSAEQILSSHEAVQSALIVGSDHEQPLLLVEPKAGYSLAQRRTSVQESEELRRANETLPAYAQIDSEHICVVEPDTFLRSAKGEVRRRPTVAMLDAEIVNAYASAENQIATETRLDFSSKEKLTESLLSMIIAEVLPGTAVLQTEDLFSYGIDSQGVLRLTRAIRADMRAQQQEGACQVAPRMVYKSRTADRIAAQLYKPSGTAESQSEAAPEDVQRDLQDVLDRFSKKLPERGEHDGLKIQSETQTFLLTGSTGSLGSYLLDALLRQYPAAKVVCLNRVGGNAAKQQYLQQIRGLSDDLSRAEFIEAKMAEEHFGLDDAAFQCLQQTTHIIHNAWKVNFNLPLSEFEEQLEICCNLIKLAHSCTHRVSTTFLSSIGTANDWAKTGHDGQIPETQLDDFNVAEKNGYAQSKLLAEHLFANACSQLQLDTTICRLGQIAGPVRSDKGCWNVQEWFPSIMLSSKSTRMLPKDLAAMDPVDWIPVDILADVLAEVVDANTSLERPRSHSPASDYLTPAESSTRPASSGSSLVSRSGLSTPNETGYSTPASSIRSNSAGPSKDSASPRFLHFVNPSKIDWRELAPSVVKLLSPDVELVSYAKWTEAISASIEQDSEDVPAAKLVDFFEDLGKHSAERAVFSVKESTKLSNRLRDLQPVSVQWLERWMRQWSMPLTGEE